MFKHITDKKDREKLISLQKEIEKLVDENEKQERLVAQGRSFERPSWNEVNKLRADKEKILKKYDHLLPETNDPFDLYK